MLTDDELAALDDWRFSHRMPSRASAIRELLKRGLAAEGFNLSGSQSRSKDYGVTVAASKRIKEKKPAAASAGGPEATDGKARGRGKGT